MLKDRVISIVEKIKSLHVNDPGIYEYWDDLTEILSKNERETIDLLLTCNDESIISNVSSVFDDISKVLQSREFAKCLIELDNKYSHLNIHHMVQVAINMIDDIDSEDSRL